jgi:pSer/pThr/pTyr-binding forkhead associated (FHA) protein
MSADERTAILFSPPLPPLRLGVSRPISIGRHPDCEFPIREEDVSRRHAEVRFQDGGYVLYDLESTNGTYLNNERVAGMRNLLPGDRIEIGSSTITFCEIESTGTTTWGDADNASTVICERPLTSAPRFSGLFAEVPPAAVFQLLEMGSNSGLLEIASDAGRMRVWFEMGRPVHAETDKLAGFDAVLEIVNLPDGQFRFGPCGDTPSTTIMASVTEVLLEACRLQDESGRS